MITQSQYEKCLKGFRIIDCAVRNPDIFYFTAIEDFEPKDEDDEGPPETELCHRIIAHFARQPLEAQWDYQAYQGVRGLYAAATKYPDERFIGIDRGGYAIVLGGDVDAIEEPIPGGPMGPRRGGVRKVKAVDGRLYICTGNRGLARRDGPNNWTSLCSNLLMEDDIDSDAYFDQGFEDFDSFDGREFYCAGTADAWYLQDGRWERIPLPADRGFRTVCCSGDGWAYIGCEDRTIWRGRHGNWQLFEKPRSFFDPIPRFNDMVWFQDRVYCVSDFALWEIIDDECSECPLPEEVKECCGNLSVADGIMLMAGEYGAAHFDGKEWTVLYRAAEFRP